MKTIKQFISGFKSGMQKFGQTISIVVNSILLSIVYLIGVGITSIASKILGKHFLETRLSKKRESYWSKLDLKKKPIDEYYNQF
jgi:hypothetical protein